MLEISQTLFGYLGINLDENPHRHLIIYSWSLIGSLGFLSYEISVWLQILKSRMTQVFVLPVNLLEITKQKSNI